MSDQLNSAPMLNDSFTAKGALRASLRYTAEDDQWQTSMCSLRERNKHMFNNELFSDVRFLVGRSAKQSIPAHKYIMSISSPVFSSMFFAFGALQAEQLTREQIEISECEPAAFLELLRYLYYDEVQLTTITAPEVLYLARKYLIPHLADICTDFLVTNLTVDNSLTVLDQCCMLGVGKGLEKQCWDIVDKRAENIADDVTFVEIDHGTLTAFLCRDTLVAKETTLFNAAVRWAGKECQRLKLPLTAEARRQVLGDTFYSIRFPLMSMKDFTDQVARSGYLTYEEVANMYIGFNSGFQKCHVKFPIRPRGTSKVSKEKESGSSHDDSPLYRCKRYIGFPELRRREVDDGVDEEELSELLLTVDYPVILAGVSFFSVKVDNESEEEYRVNVILTDKSGQKVSEFEGHLKCTDEDGIQDVLLSPRARLTSGDTYTISVRTEIPTRIHGNPLTRDVTCEGVKFSFCDGTGSEARIENSNSENNNQIAGVIFCFPKK